MPPCLSLKLGNVRARINHAVEEPRLVPHSPWLIPWQATERFLYLWKNSRVSLRQKATSGRRVLVCPTMATKSFFQNLNPAFCDECGCLLPTPGLFTPPHSHCSPPPCVFFHFFSFHRGVVLQSIQAWNLRSSREANVQRGLGRTEGDRLAGKRISPFSFSLLPLLSSSSDD